MLIDTLFTPESGTLYFPTFFDFTHPKDSQEIDLPKDLLRILVSTFVLPVFSTIGIFYNIVFGLLKIPLHLFIWKNRTLYYQKQLQQHFSFALIDALVSYLPLLRTIFVIYHFLYPKEMVEHFDNFKTKIKENVEKNYIDSRLKI